MGGGEPVETARAHRSALGCCYVPTKVRTPNALFRRSHPDHPGKFGWPPTAVPIPFWWRVAIQSSQRRDPCDVAIEDAEPSPVAWSARTRPDRPPDRRPRSCHGRAHGTPIPACCTPALRYLVGVSAVVLRVAALACGSASLTAGAILAGAAFTAVAFPFSPWACCSLGQVRQVATR